MNTALIWAFIFALGFAAGCGVMAAVASGRLDDRQSQKAVRDEAI